MAEIEPYYPGCPQCGSLYKFHRCSECKVAFYCNELCKEIDAAKHGFYCKNVRNTRSKYEAQRALLSTEQKQILDPSSISFEEIAHFKRHPFRAFAEAQRDLVTMLQQVETRQAAEERAYHMRAGAVLYEDPPISRYDSVGLSIRLNQDKECYQFTTQMHARVLLDTSDNGFKTEIRDSAVLFKELHRAMDPKNSHPLSDMDLLLAERSESPDRNIVPNPDLFILAAASLLKFRLLEDLKKLRLLRQCVGPKVPQEIFDKIEFYSTNNDLSIEIFRTFQSDRDWHKSIATLEDQIEVLFAEIHPNVWRILLDGQNVFPRGTINPHIPEPPGYLNGLNFIEWYLRDAWLETPGVSEYFSQLRCRVPLAQRFVSPCETF